VDISVAVTHDRLATYNPRKDEETNFNEPVSESRIAPLYPGLQGRIGLKLPAIWAGEKANLSIGVGGLFARGESAQVNKKERNDKPEPSYAVGIDMSLPVLSILTLTGELFWGQNLSRYGNGSLDQHCAYSQDCTYAKNIVAGTDKDLGGIKSIGWWAGYIAKLPFNFSVAGGAGAESLDEDSKRIPAFTTQYMESNMFIFANLGYNFTPEAKITFEYLTYSTDYTTYKPDTKKVGSDNSSINRFELNFRYDFR
jgi:hypothetical protein